ncbi:hypothetical protein FN846DRAFT_918147 [Sphaerosporella brunnea]|uniref:Uncharacterized protein n=1 Tax=Sphaerosporella brunnea TaxID=1250544 RepID=A0A5J5F239_9PEZI|nr:hypothetical protein FN846DRAFT_918147 [Sphaerosporella brunnea]
MPSKFVFRARGFPVEAEIHHLKRALEGRLSENERLRLLDRETAIVPPCSSRPDEASTRTVLFTLEPPVPVFLAKLAKQTAKTVILEICEKDVTIDMQFLGFTQLYAVDQGKPIVADIVALTGINSHAYGSWKAKEEPERMWLRDFFPQHFPNCRTMIYGYNASLKTKSVHRLQDFTQEFLHALKRLRSSEEEQRRPLIFIGHSYGGILVAHTLVKAKFEQRESNDPLDCLLKATYGILFFGTPHRGMVVKNLVEALEKGGHTQRLQLLEEIKQEISGTGKLKDDLARFIDLCTRFKICSVYELEETPNVVVAPDDTWRRGEEYAMAVEDGSALLKLPADLEHKIPADANHSNIVKFASIQDETYQNVRTFLDELLLGATEVVPRRFCSEAVLEPIFQVPIRRNKNFVGRGGILSQLEKNLEPSQDQPRVCLCALGGSGKTEIAVEFCYRRLKTKPAAHVFWIYGDSQDSFTLGYREILERIQPQFLNQKTNLDSELCLTTVKEWLESKKSGEWVMVIDNLDNIEGQDGKGLSIQKYIPRRNGAILITSRDSRVSEVYVSNTEEIMMIEVMSDQEATDMFFQLLENNKDPNLLPGIGKLIRLFGNLPLAIAQAASYIREMSRKNKLLHLQELLRYVDLCDEAKGQQQKLLSKPLRSGSHSVAAMTTWHITFEKIKDISPPSIELLQLMSFLDPDEIPRDLLSTAPGLGLDNPLDFDEAIQHLLRFSLVNPLKGDSYRLHRLVGLYTREQVGTASGSSGVETTLKVALDAISKNFPDGEDYKNMATCNRLMPHVTAIVNYRQKELVDVLLERLPDLQHNCGGYLLRRGMYNEALVWYKGALHAREKTFGEKDENPDTLNTINSIGSVFDGLANYEEALKWFQRALSGREKSLGSNHPDTLQTVHNMANVIREQAKFEEALNLYRRALVGRENDPHIGPDHPETLRTINCIANVFFAQGKYDDALAWYKRALVGREEALGNDHPDTLYTIHNIAGVYQAQDEYDQAFECISKALVGLEKALGADNPLTMPANTRFADILRLQQKFDEALKRFERTLVVQEKRLGSDHRQTLETIYKMADTFFDQGKPEMAIEWFKKALAGREKVLGSAHPDTRAAMSAIAFVLEHENKYEEALAWYTKAIAGHETTEDHDTDTLYTFHNIASLLFRSGKYSEAIQWYEKSFVGLEKTLGLRHSLTLQVLAGMAASYEKQQPQPNFKKALEIAQRVLAEIRKVTANSRQAVSDDLAAVRQEMERVVADISADGSLNSATDRDSIASPAETTALTLVERHDSLPLGTNIVDGYYCSDGTPEIKELSQRDFEPPDGGKKRKAEQELELADGGKRRKTGNRCIILWQVHPS